VSAPLEHLLGARHLFGGEHSGVVSCPQRTFRGVELDRQGHDLEQHRAGEAQDPEIHQPLQRRVVEEESDQEQREGQHGADVRDRNDRRADRERDIATSVLEHVSDLVGADRDRRERRLAVVVGRQPNGLGAGVVVVAQHPADLLDLYIIAELRLHDRARDVAAGEPLAARMREYWVGVLDLPLRPHREDQRGNDHHHGGIEEAERHVLSLLGSVARACDDGSVDAELRHRCPRGARFRHCGSIAGPSDHRIEREGLQPKSRARCHALQCGPGEVGRPDSAC
jgi:hypothetical protein